MEIIDLLKGETDVVRKLREQNRKLTKAVTDLSEALLFMDTVNNSNASTKLAVGNDHWDRLLMAANKVVNISQFKQSNQKYEL